MAGSKIRQQFNQSLSPQQLQFMQLLELPVTDIEQRIKREVEENPVLEIPNGTEEEVGEEENSLNLEWQDASHNSSYDAGRFIAKESNDEQRETVVVREESLIDFLERQLMVYPLSERHIELGKYLIGSLDEKGYLESPLDILISNIEIALGIESSEEELGDVLSVIQTFDPAGVGARDLQECLLLQLPRVTEGDAFLEKQMSTLLIKHYEDFSQKRFDKIMRNMGITEEELLRLQKIILTLNPSPGKAFEQSSTAIKQTITPDFFIEYRGERMFPILNELYIPKLQMNSHYLDMLNRYEEEADGETAMFIRKKIEDAAFFIKALQQRKANLLSVISYVMKRQRTYFLSGDDKDLLPLSMKEVAEYIGVAPSTVSRIAGSKYVQTSFGIFPLKHFFASAAFVTDGESRSNSGVKAALQNLIDRENKKEPLTDDRIEELLRKEGHDVSRRTIAKYRKALKILPARLRREL